MLRAVLHYAVSASPSYIASVFESNEALAQWMQKVPPELRGRLELKVDEAVSLPAFLVECNGFEWLDEQGLVARLSTWAPSETLADGFANLYFLSGPWTPPRPGTDYMGVITHIHLTAEYVRLAQREGIDAFYGRWLHRSHVKRLHERRARRT